MTALRERLATEGPLRLDRFMEAAIGAYYAGREPFGRGGDFTTSPEISQIFGELLGLWCAETWRRLGEPRPVILAELGPGRGTLMSDALRAAARAAPAFRRAVTVHLVETSPRLRSAQATLLGDEPTWHDTLDTLPVNAPLLLLANEFFDALPIRQFVRRAVGWRERAVALDAQGECAFVDLPVGEPLAIGAPAMEAPEGAILECAPARRQVAAAIGRRLVAQRGAALVIDYGYAGPALGDTLQALRAHKPAPPLATPGEADLTAHVDFAPLADAAAASGARVMPLATQGRFLQALGLEAREAQLLRQAPASQAILLRMGARRLVDPQAMGRLFKVMGMADPGLMSLPGWDRAC